MLYLRDRIIRLLVCDGGLLALIMKFDAAIKTTAGYDVTRHRHRQADRPNSMHGGRQSILFNTASQWAIFAGKWPLHSRDDDVGRVVTMTSPHQVEVVKVFSNGSSMIIC